MPREVWSVEVAPGVMRDLLSRGVNPLDWVTVRERFRAFSQRLLRAKGRPIGVRTADEIAPGAFRSTSDRLTGVFTLAVTRVRRRRWLWRIGTEIRITIIFLAITPHPSGG